MEKRKCYVLTALILKICLGHSENLSVEYNYIKYGTNFEIPYNLPKKKDIISEPFYILAYYFI